MERSISATLADFHHAIRHELVGWVKAQHRDAEPHTSRLNRHECMHGMLGFNPTYKSRTVACSTCLPRLE